jgi:membrane fusion protein, multidrug efflux system
MVRRLVGGGAIVALAAMAMIGWLSSGMGVPRAAAQTAGPVVPVTAGTVAVEDVPVFLHGIGTAQAYNMVSIKSRVDGQIVKIDFKEGQDVKQGDPLLQIDPRPYAAMLAQTEAMKQKDSTRAETSRVPAPVILLSDRVLRQPDLSPSRRARQAG